VKSTPQNSYDSIAQAAKAMGVSVEALRRAKKEGAPGFRGSRVYPADLLPWLKERESLGASGVGLTEKEKLEERKLLRQCELLEEELRIKRGKAWDSNDVRAAWLQHTLTARHEMLKLVSLAPRFAGKSALECEKILRDGVGRVLDQLRKNPYGSEGKIFCPACKADISPKQISEGAPGPVAITKKTEGLKKKAKQ
jgi:hypothetical protein